MNVFIFFHKVGRQKMQPDVKPAFIWRLEIIPDRAGPAIRHDPVRHPRMCEKCLKVDFSVYTVVQKKSEPMCFVIFSRK